VPRLREKEAGTERNERDRNERGVGNMKKKAEGRREGRW